LWVGIIQKGRDKSTEAIQLRLEKLKIPSYTCTSTTLIKRSVGFEGGRR